MPVAATGALANSGFRGEVQALRALAVTLVVLFHLWPDAIPGGYIGVDTFFVISGFLITGQLSREIAETGRIRLLGFWSRRVRRLLAASLVVLAASALAIWALVPEGLWQQFFRQIGASALYVENWALVSDAVNYFAVHTNASPVQHFWSLSVEEQFYLVWPLLLLLPLFLPARVQVRRIVTIALLVLATVGSFAYGIAATEQNSSVSYFSTLTRAWEFGAGGLLALVGIPDRVRAWQRAAASWLGLAAIVVSAFLFSGATPFPGVAAVLPVAGVLAVIASGMPEVRWAPTRLMRQRHVQYLGGISYSLYLWHWPLIVLVPLVVAKLSPGYSGLGNVALVCVLIASVVLAALTKRCVEDPVRFAHFLTSHRTGRTFALMAGGMAVVVAASALGWWTVQRDIDASAAQTSAMLQRMPHCFGAAAIDPARPPCSNPALSGVLVPAPVSAPDDVPDACIVGTLDAELTVCSVGVSRTKAKRTVALVGDSHAAQWLPALRDVAKQNDWRILTMLKGSCSFSTATRRRDEGLDSVSSCVTWNKVAQKKLQATPVISEVFVSADLKDLFSAGDGTSRFENAVSGYLSAWKTIPKSVQNIEVLQDTPRPDPGAVTCLQLLNRTQRLKPGVCSRSGAAAISPDPLAKAATQDARATLIDLDDYFCSATRCNPVIGHVVVYRDQSHITATYARTLAPYLADALKGGRRHPG